MKLLGKKAKSEPDISMRFRTAMTVSMSESWNRSTMSLKSREQNRQKKIQL